VGAFRNQTVDVSVADARSTALGAFKHQATGTDFGAVAPAVTVPASAVDGDTVTISGKNGSAQVVFAAGDTALDQAAAVNAATGATGVKATAVTFAELHTLGAVGTISFNLNSTAQGTANDGTAQAIQAVITNTSDLSALRDAINGHSASTGITAELRTGNASAVILTQAQGRDIEFDTFVNSDAGADAITYRALQSDKTTALGANRTTTTAASLDSGRISGALDFISTDQYNLTSATTEIIATTVVSVNTLGAAGSLGGQSVATQGGAAGAIEVIDSALEKLNDMRAQLGASQNRFETTAAALESSAENLSAANSRIRDTDIATESAEMARAQVLSQAGVSVLAQANQLPQMALKLLG
jgi:flagellin